MRNRILLSIAAAALAIDALAMDHLSLLGTWIGENLHGDEISVTFNSNGTAMLNLGGTKIPSSNEDILHYIFLSEEYTPKIEFVLVYRSKDGSSRVDKLDWAMRFLASTMIEVVRLEEGVIRERQLILEKRSE